MIFYSNYDFLTDKQFLKQLDGQRDKTLYARIISLNMDEDPLAEITGQVVSGNINVDGSSKVRRTCNITITTDNIKIDQIYWTLNTKFYIFIGVENNFNNRYDKVIWFPQGMYIIAGFSQTLNAQGYSISIQGKDKMCLLNGDVGGALPMANEFSVIEQLNNDGTQEAIYTPIYNIIREAVHRYAQEPYHNIIINDLDICGVKLLDYIGDKPLYIYEEYDNILPTSTSELHKIFYFRQGDPEICEVQYDYKQINIVQKNAPIVSNLEDNENLAKVFDKSCDLAKKNFDVGPIWYAVPQPGPNPITVPKVYILEKRIKPEDVNKTAGYMATELTYNEKELQVGAGSTIIELLDKLVAMLGDFEYYYDLYGHFVFQKKLIDFDSSNLNTIIHYTNLYNTIQKGNMSFYDFTNGYLIESIQNKPNIAQIKNDYAIWGKAAISKNNTTIQMAIHLRYAIDKKPEIYTSLSNKQTYTSKKYDWRELIYQMAVDNLNAQSRISGLYESLSLLNKYYNKSNEISANDLRYYYDNIPQLSQIEPSNFYTDFYRYNFGTKKFIQLSSNEEYKNCLENNEYLYGPVIDYTTAGQFNSEKHFEISTQIIMEEIRKWESTFNTGYDLYYSDMLGFWRQLYNIGTSAPIVYNDDGSVNVNENGELVYFYSNEEDWSANGYWNPQYFVYDNTLHTVEIINPESLIFWIDFLNSSDEYIELNKYSVKAIGRRVKVKSDDKIKAIAYRDAPNILYVGSNIPAVSGEEKLAYKRYELSPGEEQNFSISAQGRNTKDELDSLLYDSTYYHDTITISSVPIYYLEPNTRISINDSDSGINGEYIIKSFSIQLQHTGMMQITAYKTVSKMI